MSRKRKNKKSKPGGDGQWSTTGVDTSEERSGSAMHESSTAADAKPDKSEVHSEKNSLAGAASEGIRWDSDSEAPGHATLRDAAAVREPRRFEEMETLPARKPEKARLKPSEASDADPDMFEESERDHMTDEKPTSEGLMGKIRRWWSGPSPVSVRVPSNPQALNVQQRAPAAPPAGAVQPSSRVPSGNISQVSGGATGGPSSAVSQVHAALMLERVLPELEETKRTLHSERESAKAKIRELENDCDRFRAEAEKARNERGDIEGHTNVLRKSVTALERQLQEEKATAAKQVEELEARIHSFEESIKNTRSPVVELRSELDEGKVQREQLESLLERAKEELATTQRQLQEEQEISRGRIQQLESELSRKSGAGEQAVSERARIEERAALVQKALDVMEQQLREERESFAKQSQQLETELNQTRAKSAQLETRVSTLIGELEKNKGRSRKKAQAVEPESEEGATLTTRSAGRVLALEKELGEESASPSDDKHAAKTRISRLESRWEELKSRLLPKDKEITELRQQAEESLARMEDLEKELAEARLQPTGASSDAATAAKDGFHSLSHEAVQTLYSQSMGKLTVLMASADIVLMNPKLDPKAKGSVEDIKKEGQALLEIIKSYTLPPEPKKSQ